MAAQVVRVGRLLRPFTLHGLASNSNNHMRIGMASAAALPQPDDLSQKEFSPRINAIVDEIASLSLLEVVDLNDALKQRLRLPDIPMGGAMMMAPAAVGPVAEVGRQFKLNTVADDSSPAEAAKINFTVMLTGLDDSKKIALIKEVKKTVPGLNLVQAKKFVESLPAVVKEDIGQTDAEEIKKAMEAAGGTVEIK